MPAAYNTTERYRELENRLSECRGRINILEEKLLGSPVPLPVAEFDRLLDEYRAEQIRLAHLEQEQEGNSTPAKTAAAKERWRKQNRDRRKKLHYYPYKKTFIMARTKKTVVSGITREQAEQAFADFAAADAKVQNLTSKMDIEMTRIREKYADQLAELSATKEKNFDIMQAYAVENKEELFSKRKSLESAHGVFGFRTGTPKLKNLKGFTWAAVTNICKELLPQYIRTTDELAKDKLLADRDNPKVAEFFPKIGVQVVQEETFYVEPKKENDAQSA